MVRRDRSNPPTLGTGKEKKLNKTQEYLREILKSQPNYSAVSRDTRIPSERLKELYGGSTPTSSESGKIRSFVNRKLDISVAEVSAASGFTESEIKGRMTVRYNSHYNKTTNERRQKLAINRLTREDFYVVGHRKNKQLTIYYVIIIEDVNTGKVSVGHAFSDYYEVKRKVQQHQGNLIITETWEANDGTPYKFVTIYYGVLADYLNEMSDGESLASYVRRHRD